ncbi:septation protein SepH [Flexivirga meconopsidis]|uniref:septation protein SepH n=1 Tax=Flexivirga meconopsidis TaxID=2977121 RepID=UPI00223F1467|nr:septation protein SepH [Flexivirga meconopsidis]
MRELRLTGVHEDGEHLLLVDDEGERSQLRITEELRAAIRRDRSRALADAGVPEPEQVELRPRDVQTLLRSGLSLEDVAERSGWTVEKVSRYEAPIRAERDYVAGLARAVLVADATARRGEEGTFGERIERRLDGRGVDADDVTWDSWRSSDQDWTVQCSFPAGGKLRHATWRFGIDGRTLTPVDDEARWLGEDETSPGPLQAAAPVRDSSVYDVEAEGGLDAAPAPKVRTVRGGTTSSATAVPVHPAGRAHDRRDADAGLSATADAETVDLMAAMRERTKGRRRKSRGRQSQSAQFPADAAPPEQLDTDGRPPPAGSHPRPEAPKAEELGHDPVTGTADMFADLDLSDVQPAEDTEGAGAPDASASGEAVAEATVDNADNADADKADDVVAVDDIAPDDDRDAVTFEPDTEPAPVAQPHDDEVEAIPDRPSAARKGRPSVPSWDDIMFGRRPGRD